jgi:peptide-methionine (S)-S-oxide reductase
MSASGQFEEPIVTSIEKATTFWRAEEYHQRYFEKHDLPSCHVYRPKAD